MSNMKRIIHLILLATVMLSVSCNKDEANNTPGEDNISLTAVRGANPGIYDAQGRYRILRGVNYNVLGDYWQANPNVATTATYDSEQFRIMASYGFDIVRLLFRWSKLEPQPGQINQEYINQIKRAIEDAGKYGIYIMIDYHQDAYSKYLFTPRDVNCESPQKGWDGAPEWAVITDGASTCQERPGSRESPRAVVHAWQNLWDNTNGIQDNLIAAWAELVRQTANYDNVVGYDLINEPSLGYSSLADQQQKLSQFYDKLIKAIREAERSVGAPPRAAFFEPAVTTNGEETPAVPGANFTRDQHIVFAPHNYFEVITQNILTYEQGHALYNTLASTYQSAWFLGEWGIFHRGESEVNLPKLKRFAASEDQYLIGNTYWVWCTAPGDPHQISYDGNSYSETVQLLMELDANAQYTGRRDDLFLKVLARTRPRAIHGKPISLVSDSDTGEMTFRATADKPGVSEFWVPNYFGTPKVTGTGMKLKEIIPVEGGYKVLVNVEGTGRYEVLVGF